MAEVPLAQLRQEEDFEVEWVPFELRPEPEPTLEPHGEYIMNTWRNSVLPMAEQFGVEMHIPPVQPRTRLAHEAFEYAKRQGHAEAMADCLFRAFFQQGRDIGEIDVLVEIGQAVGVDAAGLRQCLEQRTLREDVGALLEQAQMFRISAVPTMIIGRYRIPGLVRFDDLRRVYRQIADEEAKESEGG